MALIIFSGITAFLTSATLLLSILFFAEYISFHLGYRKAFKEQSKDSNECSWDNLKIAVLVPAHNEEAGIKSTLNSII